MNYEAIQHGHEGNHNGSKHCRWGGNEYLWMRMWGDASRKRGAFVVAFVNEDGNDKLRYMYISHICKWRGNNKPWPDLCISRILDKGTTNCNRGGNDKFVHQRINFCTSRICSWERQTKAAFLHQPRLTTNCKWGGNNKPWHHLCISRKREGNDKL